MKKIIVTAEITVPDEVQVDRVKNFALYSMGDGNLHQGTSWIIRNVKARLLKKGLHV